MSCATRKKPVYKYDYIIRQKKKKTITMQICKDPSKFALGNFKSTTASCALQMLNQAVKMCKFFPFRVDQYWHWRQQHFYSCLSWKCLNQSRNLSTESYTCKRLSLICAASGMLWVPCWGNSNEKQYPQCMTLCRNVKNYYQLIIVTLAWLHASDCHFLNVVLEFQTLQDRIPGNIEPLEAEWLCAVEQHAK